MYEIERKYHIKNKAALLQRISQVIGVKKLREIDQTDAIFLPQDKKTFEELSKGDPVVRLRRENDTTQITLKKSMENSSNIELETNIEDYDTTEQILLNLSLNQVTLVKKRRTEYSYKDYTLTIDSVEGLGDFLEIEYVSNYNDPSIEKKIKAIANELGLEENEYEPLKYDALLAAAK